MAPPNKLLRTSLYDPALVCRGCLIKTGEMKNMIDCGLTKDFYKFINVQVNEDDFLQLLCVKCEEMLIKFRGFKLQCQVSYLELQDTLENEENEEIFDEIMEFRIVAPDTAASVYLPCPYECTKEFTKKNDFLSHLMQVHKIDGNKLGIERQYYCSYDTCEYNISSSQNCFFKERKVLNQHYFKVHKEKDICCNECKGSFSTESEYSRHFATCKKSFVCQYCLKSYRTHYKLAHMMKEHPEIHQQHINRRKLKARKYKVNIEAKKEETENEKLADNMIESCKRYFETQPLNPEDNIRNDAVLPACQSNTKNDEIIKYEKSTQTVTNEDDSLFVSQTKSLSDSQTQTVPLEFGLSRCNKETITSQTQIPDLIIKETQTCYCLYASLKPSFRRSPSLDLTSTETQTAEVILKSKSEKTFSLHTVETNLGYPWFYM